VDWTNVCRGRALLTLSPFKDGRYFEEITKLQKLAKNGKILKIMGPHESFSCGPEDQRQSHLIFSPFFIF
jgi:hypothetical protein